MVYLQRTVPHLMNYARILTLRKSLWNAIVVFSQQQLLNLKLASVLRHKEVTSSSLFTKYCREDLHSPADQILVLSKMDEDQKNFFAEHAKSARSTCKECKQKIDSGELRLGKTGFNVFSSGPTKMWYHVECLFKLFLRQRATTARIKSPDDIEGWDDLTKEDQLAIMKSLPANTAGASNDGTRQSKKMDNKDQAGPSHRVDDDGRNEREHDDDKPDVSSHKDDSLQVFTAMLDRLSNESSYKVKSSLIYQFFLFGTDQKRFKGDLRLWVKMLLPKATKRVYNLRSLQLIKIFSKIFHADHQEMLDHYNENGDIASTIKTYFSDNIIIKPASKSTLTLQKVNSFLERLTKITHETDQIHEFDQLVRRCTVPDLRTIICLVNSDLRINLGIKHVLDALHPEAYSVYQTTSDLDEVLIKISFDGVNFGVNCGPTVMTGIQPMLAEACKSIAYAIKKFPNGMFAEIKYDGERVQVHKVDNEFKYFSRALKPVTPNKVNFFENFIPQAFPKGSLIILDCEMVLVDKSGTPLPFGTLGIHKRQEFKESSVCLYVFDILFYNGCSLLQKTMKARKELLKEIINEIPGHVMLSATEEIYTAEELQAKLTEVFRMGLEGIVLKGFDTIYEPHKRRWLKIKRDYLNDGTMADTADLVVLGAFYGTGQRGGMMSIFLMGCWDPDRQVWIPVTNVATGLTMKTLNSIQSELKMVKIGKNPDLVPHWLKCPKKMIPDLVAKNPKEMPVWEITGAEFSSTADGISIRFPRITKFRDDKTWDTATSLPELKELFKKSKDTTDFTLPSSSCDYQAGKTTPVKKKTVTSGTLDRNKGESPLKKETVGSQNSNQKESGVLKRHYSSSSSSQHDDSPYDFKKQPKQSKIPEQLFKKSKDRDVSSSGSSQGHNEVRKTSPEKNESKLPLLPNIFSGVQMYIPDSHDDVMRRFFVAYGGTLLRYSKRHLATHIIYKEHVISNNEKKLWPAKVIHVHENWVKYSILFNRLQPTKPYEVTIVESV